MDDEEKSESGMAPFPYGYDPNQIQQYHHALQASHMGGMQFSASPYAPPNYPGYYHPYQMMMHPSMGGMPPHLHHPMHFAAGAPHLDPGQSAGHMPPSMAGQIGGHMPMMAGMGGGPYVQYVMVPVPVPAPTPFKKDGGESAHTSSRRSYSVSTVIEQKDVKQEPVDQQDLSTPGTNWGAVQPIKSNYSPAIPVPAHWPIAPPPPPPPDTPASPDSREDWGTVGRESLRAPYPSASNHSSVTHPRTSGGSSLEQLIVYDGFRSRVQTPGATAGLSGHRAESPIDRPSVPPRFGAKPARDERRSRPKEERRSLKRDSRSAGGGRSLERKEESHATATVSTHCREESPDLPPRRFTEKPAARDEKRSQTKEELKAPRRASKSPELPPSVPRRFTEKPSKDEERSKPKEESLVGGTGGIAMEGSTQRETTTRAQGHTILVRGVSSKLDEGRIRRFFQDSYGRCRVTRVQGEKRTMRVEFVSKLHRDRASERTSVTVCKEKLTIHEEGTDNLSEPKEEKRSPSREVRARSPMAIATTVEAEPATPPVDMQIAAETSLALEKCQVVCGSKAGSILTAGPIPAACSASRVVDYFTSLQCTVLDVPFPTKKPHEYLILRFASFIQAKKILAMPKHTVDGYVIEVSPPFDVYLLLNGTIGLEMEQTMGALQSEAGVLASLPRLHMNHNLFGFVSFGRPQDGQAAVRKGHYSVCGQPFRVIEAKTNSSFVQYQDVWDAKCHLDAMSREVEEKLKEAAAESERKKEEEERKKREKEERLRREEEKRKEEEHRREERQRKNVLREDNIGWTRPILTVGPIPSHCLQECDQHLLSTFDEVYKLPFAMKDRHFRLLTGPDPAVVAALLKEGCFLSVGKERVLISPSFDVSFRCGGNEMIDVDVLVDRMQRKFGPIVRRPIRRPNFEKMLTFGRIQDALRAIDDATHYKSNVIAEEALPNLSFAHFSSSVDVDVLLRRAREAEIEEAMKSNLSVARSSSSEVSEASKGEKRRRAATEQSIDEKEGGPAPKKAKSEVERTLRVRVADPSQWIPDKTVLLGYFNRFGKVVAFEFNGNMEAFVQFEDAKQAQRALEIRKIKIEGVKIDVLPFESGASR